MFKSLIKRFKKTHNQEVDKDKRNFLVNSIKIASVLGAVSAFVPFVSALNPNKKILRENAPLTVDISNLQPGSQMTVIWRGKPVWILHRTAKQLQSVQQYNANLRDPDSLSDQQPSFAKNSYRSINPRYLVMIGLCTHLGCSPKLQTISDDKKSAEFYCPCHGSRFDLSGRVYKNMPAPLNMEVPPYYFLNDHTLVIGETHEIL